MFIAPTVPESEKPKVAVCFPSGENVNVHFFLSMIRMLMSDKETSIACMANCCSSRVAFNRNHLVEQAKGAGATHMLFIDADTIFPWNGLQRLLAHDLDIVGATTSKRNEDNNAVGQTLEDGGRLQVPSPPVKMKLLGMPFMLIKMSVFDELRAPWFAEPPNYMMGKPDDIGLMPEDEYFCHTAMNAGFDVYCDPVLSLEIGHRGTKTFYIMNPEPESLEMAA